MRRCRRSGRCSEDLLPRRQEVADHHVAGPATGEPRQRGVRQADLLAVGEDHPRSACAGGSRPSASTAFGAGEPAERAGRAGRVALARAGVVEQLGVERGGHLEVVGPWAAARRRSPRRGRPGSCPRRSAARGRGHVGRPPRGDVDEQGDEPARRWSPRRTPPRTTRRASSPSCRRSVGVVGEPAQRGGERRRRRRRARAARCRRRARSRGSRRRRSTRAAARRRRPRTAPSAGSRRASAGRRRRPGGTARSAPGCSAPSPWWTRTPSAGRHRRRG